MRDRLRRWWKSTRSGWLRWRRTLAWILFIGALLAGVSWAGWWLLHVHPHQAAEEARKATTPEEIRALERRDRVFGTGGQLLLGVAVILGAGFALWRVLVLDKQVKITEQGQITERFTRAIEQLGDEHGRPAVRLGGIYALERIAKDSPRDHPQVMEVLCAFVREEAGGPRKPVTAEPEPPEATVQAALEVIGRNPLAPREQALNLFRVKITGAQLPKADLRGANLVFADLSAAILEEANLSGASFCGADLSFASLRDTNLAGADCRKVDFSRADLEEADLTGADLRGADLSGARNLTREQIESARIDEHTKLPDGLLKEESEG